MQLLSNYIIVVTVEKNHIAKSSNLSFKKNFFCMKFTDLPFISAFNDGKIHKLKKYFKICSSLYTMAFP